MSNSKPTSNKSAAVQKAAANAQQAQARLQSGKAGAAAAAAPSNNLLENPMYFLNLAPSSVNVKTDKKNKSKLHVEFDIGGANRSSGNRSSNTTKVHLCEQLVSAGSRCAGEGNVGVKHKGGEFTRGDAKFGISFKVGSTASNLGGEELLNKQRASHKWVFDVACVALGRVYDLKLEDWKGPIDEARNEALRDLWRDMKDESGQPLRSDVDLQALIESSTPAGKQAAKRVEAHARDMFIKIAVKNDNMPCAPIYDDARKNIIGHKDLHTHGSVYKYTQWSENHPHRKATGPSIGDLPSTQENWGEIRSEMTKIGREYTEAYHLFHNKIEKPRKKIDVLVEVIDPVTCERVMEKCQIGDPFWNPLLQTEGGRKVDTLVLPQIVFGIKRGLNNAGYGVKVRYDRNIRMIAQEPRPIDMPEYTSEFQTGFVEDEPEQKEVEDGEVVGADEEMPPLESVPPPPQAADEDQPAADEEDEQQAIADGEEAEDQPPAEEDEQPAADEDEPQPDDDGGDDAPADEDLAAQEAELLAAEEAARLAAEAAAKAKSAAAKRKAADPAADKRQRK